MEHSETKQAFLSLYDAQADAVYRYCVYKISDQATAEDITQETFLRFWQFVRRGVWPANPRAYLFRLTRNLVIDWFRKKKSLSLEQLQGATGFDVADETVLPIVLQAEAGEARRALTQLDEVSRHAIERRFLHGWTPREIALETGESANVISVRINRALKQLRVILQTEATP